MLNRRFTCFAFLATLIVSNLGCASSDGDNPGDPNPGLDAGHTDSGSDSGRDAGHDTGSDSGSDSGPGCTTAANCPAPSGECVERTCKTGVCGEQPKAAGTAVDAQTAGDCKRAQCDGAGKVVTVNDDADIPVDNRDCTNDVCTNGAPSNPAKAAGTACGAGGALKCDGAGACVGCLTANDCQGKDTDCSTRTCDAGVCGRSSAPLGKVAGAQTPGDCKKVVCDGAGATTTQNDDDDVPVDNNSCTNDVCSNGTPSNTPVANGTSCNGAAACFNGTCGGCGVAADCPGTDNDCRTRTCSNNVCGASFAAAGAPTAAQAAGDCHEVRCDGAGGTVNEVHDADLPDDGNECTSDLCTNGVVSNPNLASGTPCNENGGSYCNNAGMCVAPTCNDGTQNGSETGVDCGGSCPPCAPDVTVAVVPADGATNVAVASAIELTFTSAMTPATLTTQQNAGPCSGSIQVSSDNFVTCIGLAVPVIEPGNTDVTVTPTSALAFGTTYKVKVTTDAKNANGADITPYTMPAGFSTVDATCPGSAVVISQVYGGGGNSNAVYKNDFIELHNRGRVAVSLAGWSVQYASTNGGFSANGPSNVTELSGTIPAGGYFLIQEANGAGNGVALPAADLTGEITIGSSGGKIALVSSKGALGATCSGATVVDLVAWGSGTSCREGAGAAGATTNPTGVIRKDGGCTDTNNNGADFDVVTPVARNSATPAKVCVCAP